MFKKFSQLFGAGGILDNAIIGDTKGISAGHTESQAEQGSESGPVYRCDLIAHLRNQQRTIIDYFDQVTCSTDPAAVERLLARMQEAYRSYCAHEAQRLYPFLEYYARHFGTDDATLIRESAEATQTLGRMLHWTVNDKRRPGEQPAELFGALRDQVATHFRRKQATIYPLYHKYGIQLMRIH